MPYADPGSAGDGRGRLVSQAVATSSLDKLLGGQRGLITRIDGEDGLVQRLMEMGLLEGEEVEVVGFAPMGDPMEVRLGDYRLSLRRVEAARVHVEPL